MNRVLPDWGKRDARVRLFLLRRDDVDGDECVWFITGLKRVELPARGGWRLPWLAGAPP